MAGYLFVYFIGEEKDGEQIYFSLSRDGLHWTEDFISFSETFLYMERDICQC